jgi:hypothetical protein
MSQERAQSLVMELTEVLADAFERGGFKPERIEEELKKTLKRKQKQTL